MTRALVRRPSPRLAEGLISHIERTPVDVDLAARAVAGLRRRAGRSNGWTTIEVDPVDDCPDSVFIEDTMLVYRDLAVIARSGAEVRRGELATAEAAIADQGYRIERITGDGTLDGGDVLKIGDRIYVGRGGRTNDEGIAQLAAPPRAAGRERHHGPDHQGAAPQERGDGAARRHRDRLPAAGRRHRRPSTRSSRCPRSPARTSYSSATTSC